MKKLTTWMLIATIFVSLHGLPMLAFVIESDAVESAASFCSPEMSCATSGNEGCCCAPNTTESTAPKHGFQLSKCSGVDVINPVIALTKSLKAPTLYSSIIARESDERIRPRNDFSNKDHFPFELDKVPIA